MVARYGTNASTEGAIDADRRMVLLSIAKGCAARRSAVSVSFMHRRFAIGISIFALSAACSSSGHIKAAMPKNTSATTAAPPTTLESTAAATTTPAPQPAVIACVPAAQGDAIDIFRIGISSGQITQLSEFSTSNPQGATVHDAELGTPGGGCPGTRDAFNSDFSKMAVVVDSGDLDRYAGTMDESGSLSTVQPVDGGDPNQLGGAADIVQTVDAAFAPGTDTLWWLDPSGKAESQGGQSVDIMSNTYAATSGDQLHFETPEVPVAYDSGGQWKTPHGGISDADPLAKAEYVKAMGHYGADQLPEGAGFGSAVPEGSKGTAILLASASDGSLALWRFTPPRGAASKIASVDFGPNLYTSGYALLEWVSGAS
jgi:hypothetical protein